MGRAASEQSHPRALATLDALATNRLCSRAAAATPWRRPGVDTDGSRAPGAAPAV
ncbi:hypothetical protein [Corynebacterium glyciniphilum]|uniref:hypothetical protein n=1 Tax=Corynebacterium glyciniphilum TaxID=1404244 RepID=UPI00130EB66F|nr:hypothetical protein [Corynebacterium glyciniphilum]